MNKVALVGCAAVAVAVGYMLVSKNYSLKVSVTKESLEARKLNAEIEQLSGIIDLLESRYTELKINPTDGECIATKTALDMYYDMLVAKKAELAAL